MKDMWVGFLVVMMTTFVGFGLVCGQIPDIREELGRIDGMLSGIEKRLERMEERAGLTARGLNPQP